MQEQDMQDRDGRKLVSISREAVKGFVLAIRDAYDEIYELAPYEDAVYFWKNLQRTELEGRTVKYSEYFWEFLDDTVYPYDCSKYKERFELEQMIHFMERGEELFKVQVRFRDSFVRNFPLPVLPPEQTDFPEQSFPRQSRGGDWMEITVCNSPLHTGKLIVLVKNIQKEKINSIVSKLAVGDYDYVICIQVIDGKFIICSSRNDMTDTEKSYDLDYEGELIPYAYSYIESEHINDVITKMSLAEIVKGLESQEEYIVDASLWENGVLHHKKHRFIYWDQEKTRILMSRTDVTEQIEQERAQRRKIHAAYQEAAKASQAKSEFISQMSHDIRTPLNSIMGMTVIAGTHVEDKDQVISCLNNIVYAGKHLLSLVNEVLDVSRMESGRMKLEKEAFFMDEALSQMTEMIQGLITEHNHTLKTDFDQIDHRLLLGDLQHMNQIFLNLMGNSIKYTPDGGELKFCMRKMGQRKDHHFVYEMVIEDNGIGMSQEYLHHIFEPFSRAQDSRINQVPGSGLGMTIVRNLVRLMDGEISVESHMGQGTRFCVALPFEEIDKK